MVVVGWGGVVEAVDEERQQQLYNSHSGLVGEVMIHLVELNSKCKHLDLSTAL